MTLTHRPTTESDIPFLLALRVQSMGPHLAAAGIDATEADYLVRVRYRLDCAEVLLRDGVPVGLLKVVREATTWTVMQIQFLPEVQGQGLGARVLRQVIADARRAGVALCLSVLKANPAKDLYERLGFVVVGETEDEFEMQLGDAG